MVLVDRSLESDDCIELDEETRQNYQVIENLHDLFGDDDLEELEGYEGQVNIVAKCVLVCKLCII